MASSSSYSIEATDDYTNALLKQSAAKIIMNVGFSSATNITLDLSADLLERYLSKLMIDTKRVAEHSGRSKVTMTDVDHVFKKLNISFMELHDYVQQVKPFPLAVEIPEYPVEPDNPLDYEKATNDEIMDRISSIDRFLPTCYPEIKAIDLAPELNSSNASTSEPSVNEAAAVSEKGDGDSPAQSAPPTTPQKVAKLNSERKTAFPDFSDKFTKALGFKIRTQQVIDDEKKQKEKKKSDKKSKKHAPTVEPQPSASTESSSSYLRPTSSTFEKNSSPAPRHSEPLNATLNGEYKSRSSSSSTWGSRPSSSQNASQKTQDKLMALSNSMLRKSTEALNAKKVLSRPQARPPPNPPSQSHSLAPQHSHDAPIPKRKSREEKKSKEERRKEEKTPQKVSAGNGENSRSSAPTLKPQERLGIFPKPESSSAQTPSLQSAPVPSGNAHTPASSTLSTNITSSPMLPSAEGKKKSKKRDKIEKERQNESKASTSEEKPKPKLETPQISIPPVEFDPLPFEAVSPAPSSKTISMDVPDTNDDSTNPFTLGDTSTSNDLQKPLSNAMTSFPRLDSIAQPDTTLLKPHKVKKKKEKRDKEHKEKKRDKERKKEKKKDKSHKDKEHRHRSPSPNGPSKSSTHRSHEIKLPISTEPEPHKLKLKIRFGPSSGSSVSASPMQSPQNPNDKIEKIQPPVEHLVPVSPDDMPIRFLSERLKTPTPQRVNSPLPPTDKTSSKQTDKVRLKEAPSANDASHGVGNGKHSVAADEKKLRLEAKQKSEEKKKRLEEKKLKKEKKLELERQRESELEKARHAATDLSKPITEKVKSDEKRADKVWSDEVVLKKERKEQAALSRAELSSRPDTPKVRQGEKHVKKSKLTQQDKSASRSETPLYSEQRPSSSSSMKTPLKKDKEKERHKERREKEKREKEKEREKQRERERREQEKRAQKERELREREQRERELREREQREREEQEEREERERIQRQLDEEDRESREQASISDKDSDTGDDSVDHNNKIIISDQGMEPISIDLENVWVCPACNVAYVDGETNMVGCDKCDQWYHWTCVGMVEAPPQNSNWYCSTCGPPPSEEPPAKSRKRGHGSSGAKRGAKKRRV